MMKIATLVALLALAYGVDSAAMSYDEFADLQPQEISNEKRKPIYPEGEPGDDIPWDQYLQQLTEHMEEQPEDTEPPSEGDTEPIQSFEEATETEEDSAHVECQPRKCKGAYTSLTS